MSGKKVRPKKDDVVELRYWTFKFVDKKFGVVVEGYRDNDAAGSKMDNWGSSQIKSVAENGKLLTSLSGSKYRLVDNIARVEQRKYGIPDTMIDLFEKGFPRNWEQVLRPFYQKWFETNPLNAAKWWDHQQTLEKKRASLGVSLKKRSQSTGAVPRPSTTEKENREVLATPSKTADDSIIRRSPRISAVLATPNVMKSFTTIALNKKDDDNAPTPRFCPVTDGRHAISRQQTAQVPESTPIKGKMKRKSKELVFPDVPVEGNTPHRSRATETPARQTPAAAEGVTPSRRSLRSQSVHPSPATTSTPKPPAKETPKRATRANSRAPSASPAAKKPDGNPLDSVQKKKTPRSSPAPTKAQSVADWLTKSENQTEFKAPPPPPVAFQAPVEEDVFKAPPLMTKGGFLDRARSMPTAHSATVLYDWFIQFHPNQVKKTGALPPFYFTGTKRMSGAQPLGWNTSPIVRVDEGANQFEWTFYTSSGNQYKISGRVNVREMAEKQIFPMDVAQAFEYGFPSNWLELLWNVFNAYRDKGFKKPMLAPRPTDSDGNESVRSGQIDVNRATGHSTAKSQRGRLLYTPSDYSFNMPQLSAERGGGERVKQKKRSIKYGSSDDEDDTGAFMKTLRMSRYNYDSDHGPAGKRARRSNTGDLTADMRIIKNIQKRKAKLTREMAELDEYMFQVANKIDRKRREGKRLEELHRGWEQPPRQRSRAGSEFSSRKRKFQPIYEESESSSDDDDSEDELKALSDSTSTDCEDGGDWRQARKKKNKRKPAVAPQKNTRLSKEKANIFEEENKTSEDEKEEEIPKPKKEKKRNWTQEDLVRLKHVVSHVKVRQEEDWQKIADTMGQNFKAEDCKDIAVKRLHWKPLKEKAPRPEEEAMVITTRPGTLGHAIQAGEECRKYLLGAGSQELDGFRQQAINDDDDDQDIIANIAELDPDDSILEALKTPKLTTTFKKSKNRTDQPFLPTLFADEDTPKTNDRKSLAAEEPTTAKREENLRYLHEINRTDKSRLNNTTRMNMSNNYSMIDRSRAVDQVARKMEKITKSVRDQIPKRRPTSDVDEEDEEM